MNNKKTRYIALFDDIKNHVFSWAGDEDWRKLPSALNTALSTVMNELKIQEALQKSGLEDEREQNTDKKERGRFIAIFKQKYLEFTDLKYNQPITPVSQAVIMQTIKAIVAEGGSTIEFLEWFFDDFASIERNKEYMPPTINFVCSTFVVNKFLYQMKDTLRMRKKDIENVALRNILLDIAVPFLERVRDKDLSEKVLDFSNQKITPTKFIGLLKAFAEKHNDKEAMEKLNKLSNTIQSKG